MSQEAGDLPNLSAQLPSDRLSTSGERRPYTGCPSPPTLLRARIRSVLRKAATVDGAAAKIVVDLAQPDTIRAVVDQLDASVTRLREGTERPGLKPPVHETH
jgi:hypothetical protein